MEFRRVTIWALPVQVSVTMMTGHENARKASKDENKWPHDRSHLTIDLDDQIRSQTGHVPRNVVQLKISYVSRIYLI